MNLDDELRATFADWAERAPTGDTLLTGVYARSHQLTVRRRYQAVLLAAVAVLAVLLPIGLLHGGIGHSTPLPPGNPTLSAGTPSAKLPAYGLSAQVTLVTAGTQPSAPDFPLLVGWLPAGYELHPAFDSAGQSLTDPGHGLSIAITTQPYFWDWEPVQTTDTTISGHPAVLRTGADEGVAERLVGVAWQLPGTGWVTVDSVAGLAKEQVLRIARNLAKGRTPAIELPFTFGVLPVGFALTYLSADSACFSPVTPVRWRPPPRSMSGLCALVSPVDTSPTAGGVLAVLGGQAGQLSSNANGKQFDVGLQDGRLLTVFTSGIAPPRSAAQADPDYGWLEITDVALGQFAKTMSVT